MRTLCLENDQTTPIASATINELITNLATLIAGDGLEYGLAVRGFKRQLLIAALARCNYNQCRAARELGMHRNTLSRTLQYFKIDVNALRGHPTRAPRAGYRTRTKYCEGCQRQRSRNQYLPAAWRRKHGKCKECVATATATRRIAEATALVARIW